MQCCHRQLARVPNAGRDVHLEGGFWDMFVVEFDGHQVLSRLGDHVLDPTGSVLAVIEVQLCLGGTLHSDGQTPSSCLTGVDVELTWQKVKVYVNQV